MSSIFRAIIVFLVGISTISCSTPQSDCVDIFGDDVPVYPNTQNITMDGPIKDWRETYIWEFTTTDNPEKVWQFYMDELVQKWDGEDWSSPQTPEEKELHLKKGCFFTYFKMISKSIDSETYQIMIQLFKEPRM